MLVMVYIHFAGETKLTGSKQALLGETVAENSKRDVAKTSENNDQGEVNLEGVKIVLVDISIVPAHDEVVGQGQQPSGSDTVVVANISQVGHFGGDLDVRPDKRSNKLGEWTSGKPQSERVEEQLITAVCILFPSCQFIIDSQRDALFETIAGIGAKSDSISVNLQAERHVEIFRDSRL